MKTQEYRDSHKKGNFISRYGLFMKYKAPKATRYDIRDTKNETVHR